MRQALKIVISENERVLGTFHWEDPQDLKGARAFAKELDELCEIQRNLGGTKRLLCRVVGVDRNGDENRLNPSFVQRPAHDRMIYRLQKGLAYYDLLNPKGS